MQTVGQGQAPYSSTWGLRSPLLLLLPLISGTQPLPTLHSSLLAEHRTHFCALLLVPLMGLLKLQTYQMHWFSWICLLSPIQGKPQVARTLPSRRAPGHCPHSSTTDRSTPHVATGLPSCPFPDCRPQELFIFESPMALARPSLQQRPTECLLKGIKGRTKMGLQPLNLKSSGAHSRVINFLCVSSFPFAGLV